VTARRGGPLAALIAAVLVAHLWLADRALPDRIGEGAADAQRPVRIEVAFVRPLRPQAPAPGAAAAPRLPPRASRPAPAAPAAAASASLAASASAAASVSEAAASAGAAADLPLPDPASDPAPVATPLPTLPTLAAASAMPAAPASAASAAPATAAFEWPPSTRLSYRLTGQYRGPVEGQARVEWLRSGTRYQVFMDLGIGPSFAPLMSRRVSSEGEVTAAGLQPRRYDEETKVVLMAPRRLAIQMDANSVLLPDGSRRPRPPGLQDSASQFVQLTWLFTTQPELLQPGRSITLPLALPRHVEPWIYDVLGSVTLATPAGPVEAVHVKPRREARPGQDMTAEIWVAPSLQYLPVRILIRVDAETFIDLNIERLPEQAAPGK
jgi:hypothetical protein